VASKILCWSRQALPKRIFLSHHSTRVSASSMSCDEQSDEEIMNLVLCKIQMGNVIIGDCALHNPAIPWHVVVGICDSAPAVHEYTGLKSRIGCHSAIVLRTALENKSPRDSTYRRCQLPHVSLIIHIKHLSFFSSIGRLAVKNALCGL
jgi:hypothetical protein